MQMCYSHFIFLSLNIHREQQLECHNNEQTCLVPRMNKIAFYSLKCSFCNNYIHTVQLHVKTLINNSMSSMICNNQCVANQISVY